MKKKKYYNIEVGNAGKGGIDLGTGELVFAHGTVSANGGVLPVGISHFYNSRQSSDSLYGRGWGLNLEQHLHKVDKDNIDDTRYAYIDGAGQEHVFEERYFVRLDEGGKDYNHPTAVPTRAIVKSDIKISQDGRLWLVDDSSIEVFAESVNCDCDMVLLVRPQGFCGSKKVETRHDELVRVEDDIKQLNRYIVDIEEQIKQNGKLALPIDVQGQKFDTVQELQEHIQQFGLDMEKALVADVDRQIVGDYNNNLAHQKRLLSDTIVENNGTVQYNVGLHGALKNVTKKVVLSDVGYDGVSSLGSENLGTGDGVGNYPNPEHATYTDGFANKWANIDQNARAMESINSRMQYHNRNADKDQEDRIRASYIFQMRYQERIERIQQEIQDLVYNIETNNWRSLQRQNSEQKRHNADRLEMELLQRTLIGIQKKFGDARLELLRARWNEDLEQAELELSRRVYMRDLMILQLPVDYVIGEYTLGFNEDGRLVSIFDEYDNQVVVVYKDSRIDRVVGSDSREIEFEYVKDKLVSIKDFADRVTRFWYDDKNNLSSIVRADGSSTAYFYDSDNRLVDILSPSKIGVRVAWAQDKVVEILKLSQVDCITKERVVSGVERTESVVAFGYSQDDNTTTVFEPKTGGKTNYIFGVDSELLYTHIESEFARILVTTKKTDKHNIYISQKLDDTSNVEAEKAIHYAWTINPNDLPAYREHLQWKVIDLDNGKNPRRTRTSQRVLVQDENIRQSVEEFFVYKEYADGRPNKLCKKITKVKTTGKVDKIVNIEYIYNKQGQVIRANSQPSDIVTETIYSDKGVQISKTSYHADNPDVKFVTELELAENGQVLAEFDESGRYKTSYDYINKTNTVYKVFDPNGVPTVLGLDSANDNINSMSTVVDCERNANSFGYTAEYLTRLQSDETKFEYEYDCWGRQARIMQGEKVYVTYEYTEQGYNPHTRQKDSQNNWIEIGEVVCDLVKAKYASGETYMQYTDKYGRLLGVHYIGVNGVEKIIISNHYDIDKASPNYGRLTTTVDYKANQTTSYVYDKDGNIVKQEVKGVFAENKKDNPDRYSDTSNQYVSVEHVSDIEGNIQKLVYTTDDNACEYNFEYDENTGQLDTITLPTDAKLNAKTDKLGRLSSVAIASKENQTKPLIETKHSYLQYHDHATNLVTCTVHKINGVQERTRFVYDKKNNIKEIRDSFNNLTNKYEYDDLNRITYEDNQGYATARYAYDNRGNIVYKICGNKYEKVVPYEYDGDRLVSYGGEKCSYDSVGNPTTYRNKKLTWSHTRNLTAYDTDNQKVEYKYNANNLRIYKDYTIDASNPSQSVRYTHYYSWIGDRLISETKKQTTNEWTQSQNPVGENTEDLKISTSTVTLDYLYGASDMIGVVINGEAYYYIKNIQNDVTGIVDANGRVVARYAYDAFGSVEIFNNTSAKIGDINPIRYRSYYWDTETKLYYLKSRYYDPEVGRFVNQDDIKILQESKYLINGLNLYAYCNNNPVNRVDSNGFGWWSDFWGGVGNWFGNNWSQFGGWILAGVVLIGLGVLTLATGGATLPLLVGAGMGFLASGGTNILVQGVTKGWNNIDWGEAGFSAFVGSITGALSGGVGNISTTMLKNTGETIVKHLAIQSIFNIGASVGGYAVEGMINGDTVTVEGFALSFISGMFAGASFGINRFLPQLILGIGGEFVTKLDDILRWFMRKKIN